MKHTFLYLLAMILLCSCGGESEPTFVVKGTTTQDRLNGQLVFLVPYGSKQFEDSIGVDSVEIKDNQFEFRGKGEYLARVTIHKLARYGTQDLLIVTEGGADINVVIDSISSGGGTPQNDALQLWKDKMTEHNAILAPHISHLNYLRKTGDSVYAAALQDSIRLFNADFRKEMQQIIKVIGKGPAYDWLNQRYGAE